VIFGEKFKKNLIFLNTVSIIVGTLKLLSDIAEKWGAV